MDFSQRIQDAKTSIISGQDQVLTQALTDLATNVANDQKGSDGTLSQGDLDAAVKAATDPLNQQISDLTAKDEADIQAGKAAASAIQSQFDSLQKDFDQLKSDKSVEDSVVQGLQGQVQAIKDLADKLASIVFPQPPAPTPEPTPAPQPDPTPAPEEQPPQS